MVRFRTLLVQAKGLASLEPPDKMSTGHFSPTGKFARANFLLIQVPLIFITQQKIGLYQT